jgi:hypothetical protein
MTLPTPIPHPRSMDSDPAASGSDPATVERGEARKRLEARRKIVADFVSYIVINAFLVFVWLMSGGGYFWPGWVMAGWGILLVLHAWEAYWRHPITEADIDREVTRSR